MWSQAHRGEEALDTAPQGRPCREQKGCTAIPLGKALPALVQGKPSHFTDSETEDGTPRPHC